MTSSYKGGASQEDAPEQLSNDLKLPASTCRRFLSVLAQSPLSSDRQSAEKHRQVGNSTFEKIVVFTNAHELERDCVIWFDTFLERELIPNLLQGHVCRKDGT